MSLRNILAAASAIAMIMVATWVFSGPSYAQDKSCKYTMDEMIEEGFKPQGIPFTMVPTSNLPALVEKIEVALDVEYGTVTRAFIANVNGVVVIGLEADGCLLDPIVVPAAEGNKSGRVGNDTFA